MTADPSASTIELLSAGRAAFARHAWSEAFEALSAADRAGALDGAGLESAALAAFFLAMPDMEQDLRERAFKAHLDAGDRVRAAYVAIDLARNAGQRGRLSIAAGWLKRGERTLPMEVETYAHGYLALARSEAAAAMGDVDAAMRLAEEAIAIGDRVSDGDLRAWSLAQLGEMKIATGATPDGIALLEEASIAAVNGELSPVTSGVTACRMISACRDLSDYRRATEWIEATERYCQLQSLEGFPGVCRVHRAEVAAVGGAWEEAEGDLVRATEELERFRATVPQADGYYALGDIRRLRGDLPAAEAALGEAHARGRTPQPALGRIRLAQGRPKAALAGIESALAEAAENRWARVRLLPALIETLLAMDDVPAARRAVDDLRQTISAYPSPAFEGSALVALGQVLLAEGDQQSAAGTFREATRRWREVGAPYEVARARALLASALVASGDDEDAALEARAALTAFRRLGAVPDAEAGERLVAEIEDRGRAPEQVHRTFMFTDIVGSTTLAEALGDAAWERLLRWHDDTLRRMVATGGGELVNPTGDGFFVAFDTARRALDCSIAIQRALRDHRDSVGFAPPIRIGVHAAEANRRGRDYSGIGVHVAARVGALAGEGEILATEATFREARVPMPDEAREVSVRGVSTPLRVAAIPWR